MAESTKASNDQRSNAHNPNSAAYKAMLDNRSQQKNPNR